MIGKTVVNLVTRFGPGSLLDPSIGWFSCLEGPNRGEGVFWEKVVVESLGGGENGVVICVLIG